ncbi:MAG TPA: hypothetical protein VF455_07860 [Chryseobacterium sp.]
MSDSTSFGFYKKKYSNAIIHYSKPKDSLKLKALYFILHNLKDQYFTKANWIRAYNRTIINSKTKSLEDLVNERDSIFQIYPLSLDTVKDQEVVTNSYLIKNIDRAFESRKYRWAKNVSFSDFCEYVLPYKIGNEEPEVWGLCLNRESYLKPDSLAKVENMIQAASYVNDHLSWYKGTIDYDYPIDIGYLMSRLIATGTCNSMTRMAAFQMRALGLPIAIDYSPTWGNRSEGHSWNALVIDNRSYPFDANGPNIGYYKIEFKGTGRMPYKISKVFRKTFSSQSTPITIRGDKSEAVPEVFKTKHIKDVTDEYVPVSDIILKYNVDFKNNFGYLCTFDNTRWTPSFWGQISGHNILFKKMGRDMVYLPALYAPVNGNTNMKPIGNPFILFRDGRSKEIIAMENSKQNLIVKRKYPEDESNTIIKGDKYELFYWNGNWKSLGIQVAKFNRLYYSNVPKNALYWIKDLTEGKQERIFTYENDQQVWW